MINIFQGNPMVATFWLVPHNGTFECIGLMIDANEAPAHDGYIKTGEDHIFIWDKYKEEYDLPDVDYDYYPRGQAVFNARIHKFMVFADKCIIDDEDARMIVCSDLNLPYETTIFELDSRNSCHNCDEFDCFKKTDNSYGQSYLG